MIANRDHEAFSSWEHTSDTACAINSIEIQSQWSLPALLRCHYQLFNHLSLSMPNSRTTTVDTAATRFTRGPDAAHVGTFPSLTAFLIQQVSSMPHLQHCRNSLDGPS